MSMLLQMKLHAKRTLPNLWRRSIKTIDLSEPHLWYGEARLLKRNIICHVGGTNSGKTYTALSSLAAANNGIYCGPLRLLAWEVYETLTSRGVKCSLVTGQEKELAESGTHISCTVEMADLRRTFDVAVIDEVQLLGDESRGWAWTQAFLGLQAREIHLCGSPSFVPIITALCALTNDTITIKKYSRLTPLTVSAKSLRSFKNVEPGDCVIGFGRKHLYETKNAIESVNPGLRCSVIYGGLPPEARKGQARLFSSPDSGYDVLVASDAIGMGLNLSIKRIVFSTIEKFDGRTKRYLHPAEIKQIAGRAGRYGTQYESGEVTCMTADDLKYIRSGMQKIDAPILKAGLFPSLEQLQLLSVLLNLRVTAKIMQTFWSQYAEKECGHMEDMSGSKIFNSMSTSNILKAFGSVKSFSRELEKHLLNNGHGDMESSASDSTENISEGNLDYDHFPSGSYEEETFYDLSDDEASESDREKKRNLDAVRVAFVRGEKISEEECDALEKAHLRRMGYTAGGRSSRNLSPIKRAYEALQEKNRNSKSGVAEESSNSADDNPSVGSMFLNEDSESEWPDISDFSSTSSSSRYQKKDKDWRHERRNTSHEHRQARAEGNGMDYDMLDDFMNAQHSGSDTSSKERGPIPLSRLLSVFRRSIDMGDSKTYFLCNLDDKIALAESIDSVPMSFTNRYIFIMAPVASDNRELVGNFRSFARSFSESGIVKLTRSCLNRSVPKNPNEMLEIETLHQYFESYLWLNQRFPAAFTDSETALKESKRCAGLVERALKAFADRAASTTDKKVRKKPVLVVDRIFQKSADEVTRSGEPKLETIYRRSKVDAASGRRK